MAPYIRLRQVCLVAPGIEPVTSDIADIMGLIVCYRDGNVADASNIYGVLAAELMVQVLKQCGNDITRDNIRKQSESIKNFKSGLLLPWIAMNTSPPHHSPTDPPQATTAPSATEVADAVVGRRLEVCL